MTIKNLLLLFIPACIIISACNSEEESSIEPEGTYTGTLIVRDLFNTTTTLYESDNARLAISSCSDDCIELVFQSDGGSTTARGTKSLSSGFHSLTIPPLYETPGSPEPWEDDWTDGSGVFTHSNNSITINLTVSDNWSIGNTESAYYFEGTAN